MSSKLNLLFHTVKFLKPRQVYYQVLRRLTKARIRTEVSQARVNSFPSKWSQKAWRTNSYDAQKNTFKFLNQEQVFTNWNDLSSPKLWLYNLHYFDYLFVSQSNQAELNKLISSWVNKNPVGCGNGWEPYTISLRSVNWVKWHLAGNELSTEVLRSLFLQGRYLRKNLEFHILGNHLFANIKALLFLGVFFKGEEALAWRQYAEELFLKEFKEQFLEDGAHFELSPMYHCILLEDLLDILNLAQLSGEFRAIKEKIIEKAPSMFSWLTSMIHMDGEISFFNDACFGVAPRYSDLRSYASLLGYEFSLEEKELYHMKSSGYIKIDKNYGRFIIDASNVMASYIPGHTHADSLSFEWSSYGDRVFVNSGTSVYENSELRDFQRSTASHNTLVWNGKNSSEVWSSFRLANRAKIKELRLGEGPLSVVASHDGYSPQIHKRSWFFWDDRFQIIDELSEQGKKAQVYFYLHPEVSISRDNDSFQLETKSGKAFSLSFRGAKKISLENSFWYPEFYKKRQNHVLIIDLLGQSLETNVQEIDK